MNTLIKLWQEIPEAISMWLFDLSVRLNQWTCKHEYQYDYSARKVWVWCEKCGWNETYE